MHRTSAVQAQMWNIENALRWANTWAGVLCKQSPIFCAIYVHNICTQLGTESLLSLVQSECCSPCDLLNMWIHEQLVSIGDWCSSNFQGNHWKYAQGQAENNLWCALSEYPVSIHVQRPIDPFDFVVAAQIFIRGFHRRIISICNKNQATIR